MKRTLAFLAVLSLSLPFLRAQDKLPAESKEWLADVAPIITTLERQVFLKLTNRADRDKFIAFFWKQRDPRPDTAENEFYKTYMERISFADRTFHDGLSRRGSRTERGYYYLLLGPPLERQSYTTLSQIWPVELWFCKGETAQGLPDFFYLMFYQPEGQGPWRLYSPTVDGPEKLAVPTMNNAALTRANAYAAIKEVASPVAGASLSLYPGEKPMTTSSMTSDALLAQVRSLPERIYSDAYARTYLDLKDHIETEYSHNYIDCSALVRVYERDGRAFADWTLEPERMSFDTVSGSIYANYELILKLEAKDGSPLLERTEEIPLKLTPEQYKAHERQRVAFQDVLPLIPGESRLLLLLKNKTAKDFMSFQAKLTVPPPSAKPALGDLLLYRSREDLPERQKKSLQPFALNGRRYLFNARNEFLPRESLGGVVQALRLANDPASLGASIRFDVRALPKGASPAAAGAPDGKPADRTRTLLMSEALDPAAGTLDAGAVPLEGLAPGYYQASVTLLDRSGREIAVRRESFIILAMAASVQPWVLARPHPPLPNPDALTAWASEAFMAGDYEAARRDLEQSLTLRDLPATRLLLGRTLFAVKRYRESMEMVAPVHKASPSRDTAKLLASDLFALGEWAASLAHCEALLKEGTEISVLNTAAECLIQLGRTPEALPLLQKSLELMPDQPAIRALRDKIR